MAESGSITPISTGLDDPGEVEVLGLDRSTENGVLVVEWPERAVHCLPREHLMIQMEHAGPSERLLGLRPAGGRASAIAEQLMACVQTTV